MLTEIGATLYLCEGTKERWHHYTKNGRDHQKVERRVELCNSDPRVIQKFLEYVRHIGIDETKLRARLFSHYSQKEEEDKIFWSKIAGIPLCQFMKTSLRKPSSKIKRRLPHGTIAIRYYDANLLKTIMKDVTKVFA